MLGLKMNYAMHDKLIFGLTVAYLTLEWRATIAIEERVMQHYGNEKEAVVYQ